jgi:hypothetical protein
MRPHNVHFLDIDGVLHRAAYPGELTVATAGLGELLEERPDLFGWAQHLADALDGHACGIVVHSSWRAYVSSSALRSFLPAAIRHRFLGVTPPELERESSIQFAIRAMKLLDDEILVVDDEPESFKNLRHRLVVCDPSMGLTTLGVKEAIASWLGGTRTRPVEWK